MDTALDTVLVRHADRIKLGQSFRSYAYYVAGEIATAENWADNPDFDDSDEDDDVE